MVNKDTRKGIVRFTFDEDSKNQVYVVGDFNSWDNSATPLAKKKGKWTTELKLKPGEYQFKYYADGNWYNDHCADKYAPNDMGTDNSVVIING